MFLVLSFLVSSLLVHVLPWSFHLLCLFCFTHPPFVLFPQHYYWPLPDWFHLWLISLPSVYKSVCLPLCWIEHHVLCFCTRSSLLWFPHFSPPFTLLDLFARWTDSGTRPHLPLACEFSLSHINNVTKPPLLAMSVLGSNPCLPVFLAYVTKN